MEGEVGLRTKEMGIKKKKSCLKLKEKIPFEKRERDLILKTVKVVRQELEK